MADRAACSGAGYAVTARNMSTDAPHDGPFGAAFRVRGSVDEGKCGHEGRSEKCAFQLKLLLSTI
jgi:hypothetical protein